MTNSDTRNRPYFHLTEATIRKQIEALNAELEMRTTTEFTPATPAAPARVIGDPSYDGWLSSAGVIRNGGIRPPGTEGMKSATGTTKPQKKVKPLATAYGAVRPAASQSKPITHDQVLGCGFYKFGDTVAEVKIGKQSRKPYAMVLHVASGTFEYTPGVVRQLKASDRLTVEEAARMGREAHRCMICGKSLTNSVSIERGIGPVCAGKL